MLCGSVRLFLRRGRFWKTFNSRLRCEYAFASDNSESNSCPGDSKHKNDTSPANAVAFKRSTTSKADYAYSESGTGYCYSRGRTAFVSAASFTAWCATPGASTRTTSCFSNIHYETVKTATRSQQNGSSFRFYVTATASPFEVTEKRQVLATFYLWK